MKQKKSLKNKNFSEGDEAIRKNEVCMDCEVSTCKDCNTCRKMTEVPNIPYSTLLRKVTSEKNKLLLKTIEITAVSFVVSVVNFSRVADFEEDQLYLETILAVLLYYLATSDLVGASALLLGGLFHWYLAFSTRSKSWTVLIMTCIQVKIESVRHYEWFTMVEHLLISCVAIHISPVPKTQYVSIMIYSIAFAFLNYVLKVGIYIEDLLISGIIILANHYCMTGDHENCYLKDNMITSIIWIALKESRKASHYTGLGFKGF